MSSHVRCPCAHRPRARRAPPPRPRAGACARVEPQRGPVHVEEPQPRQHGPLLLPRPERSDDGEPRVLLLRAHRAAGRAELRVVPGRRLVRHQDRQRRRRGGGRHVPLHVQDDVQAAGHVPVRAAGRHDDHRPEPPRHADLLPRQDRRPGVEPARRQRDAPSHGPAGPPAEHRAQDDAELPRPPRRHPDRRGRQDPRRRRPATGPVLRRPRDDLRRREPRDGPRPRPARRRRGRHGRRPRHPLRLHRPHDDPPGPDRDAHVHGRAGHRPGERRRDPRGVVDRQHPLQPHDQRGRHRHELGRVPAGFAARKPARERGSRGRRPQGRVERLDARAGGRLQGRRDDARASSTRSSRPT